MSYGDTLTGLSEASEAAARAVWEAFESGAIDRVGAIARLVSIAGISNAQAIALADQGVAATLTVRFREPVPVIGVPVPDDSGRLTMAAITLLDEAGKGDTAARFARFGRCEPLDAAQRAWADAIDTSEYVSGWQRGLSSGACELCRWLEKDGYVYPTSRKMHHHTGCRCEQIIVTERL